MKKSGFTLIELLVVIVIVGVLFAVAMPVFENAGKKDTRRAAQQVMNTMRLARQHAIAHRQWTLVVFPNSKSGYSDYAKDINNSSKRLRSYAVLAATNNLDGEGSWGEGGWGKGKYTDPPADAMDFEFLTDWKMLPEGIYFDDEEDKGNYLFKSKGNKQGYYGNFEFPWNPADTDDRNSTMSAILFKPNGRVYTMCDDSSRSTPTFWQDIDNTYLYLTSEKTYVGGSAHDLPGGMMTAIHLHNKTGQMELEDMD